MKTHFTSEMEKLDWTKIFGWHIIILKLTGLWPPGEGGYGFDLYTIYMVVSAVFFHIIFISFQTINLYFIINDLNAVTGTIFILITDITASFKAYGVIRNMKQLKRLMTSINNDLFQPKHEHQKKLIMPNIRIWKMNIFAIWFFSWGCLILWSLFPLLDKSFKQYRLPFLSWYPYNAKKSPQYQLTYVFQIIAIVFLAVLNVSIDNLISFLNMYLGSQFDILCDDVRNLHDNKSLQDVSKKLVESIIHHKEIMKFANFTNQFYNWLLFIQFFASAVAMGMVMFQLTIAVPFTSQFYSFITYANAIIVQIFMYCWFGNEIEVKSNKLSYALFESSWTDLSPSVKKNMIIFLLNVKKPLQMSAFGLFYLSLETFVKILRTAWSYFALLRQVNQPQN